MSCKVQSSVRPRTLSCLTVNISHIANVLPDPHIAGLGGTIITNNETKIMEAVESFLTTATLTLLLAGVGVLIKLTGNNDIENLVDSWLRAAIKKTSYQRTARETAPRLGGQECSRTALGER